MFKLRDIVKAYDAEVFMPQGLSADIKFVTSDSRNIKPGCLFVAIKGSAGDGHSYIDSALSGGATAVVITDELYKSNQTVQVKDSRRFLSFAASFVNNKPSHKLKCIGVTGTNGKTSISYILEHLTKSLKPSVMGTVSHRCNGKVWETKLTTASPESLHSRINDFLNEQSQLCLMEVSSIAIHQKRTEDVCFDGYIFTNLSHDHIDYHKNWDNYVSCKEEFFSKYPDRSTKSLQWAVVNGDDKQAKDFKYSEKLKVISYGFGVENDCVCSVVSMSAQSTKFKISYKSVECTFEMALIGRHNIYNMTASILAALQIGISFEELKSSVKNFSGIPGRLEKASSSPYAFVDYAHTDDALVNVLKTLNAIKEKNSKLITVFGCGGDRDKAKRPKMMNAAEIHSDVVVVTSDNPRTENPESIIKDILSETKKEDIDRSVFVNVDRRKAIEQALLMAQKNDIVLIAGKGHEDYQEINGQREFFNDVLVVKESLGL